MALHREKGLCYNCDEKWNSTHRCKGRVLLFIADNTTSEPDDPNPDFSTPFFPAIMYNGNFLSGHDPKITVEFLFEWTQSSASCGIHVNNWFWLIQCSYSQPP